VVGCEVEVVGVTRVVLVATVKSARAAFLTPVLHQGRETRQMIQSQKGKGSNHRYVRQRRLSSVHTEQRCGSCVTPWTSE